MTRTLRIKIGFHRIGTVLVVLCVLPAIWAVVAIIQGSQDGWIGLLGSALGAVALYGIAWAFGWIIAGFAGDG